MVDPEGTLTAAQYEILEVVWEATGEGATVAEIWQRVAERRPITRTTVLNQVNRLEKRGWLTRGEAVDCIRYRATRSRKQASQGLVEQFVDSYFGGSAAGLLVSLLGSKKLAPADARRLRELLGDRSSGQREKE